MSSFRRRNNYGNLHSLLPLEFEERSAIHFVVKDEQLWQKMKHENEIRGNVPLVNFTFECEAQGIKRKFSRG